MANDHSAHDDFHLEAGLAWTAYLRPFGGFAAWLVAGGAAVRLAFTTWARAFNGPNVPLTHTVSFWLAAGGGLLLLLGLALLLLRLAGLRSVRLYCDAQGVWLRRGAFPWSRTVTGVRWRDLEGATFTGGLGSWLLRSYSIRIGHRYTRTSELVLEHVPDGKRLVEAINALHSRWLDAGGRPASQAGEG